MVTPKKMVSGQWPKTSPNGSPAVQGEQWGRSLWGERSRGKAGRHTGSSRNCSGEPPTARLGCRMYSSGDTFVILFFGIKTWQCITSCHSFVPILLATCWSSVNMPWFSTNICLALKGSKSLSWKVHSKRYFWNAKRACPLSLHLDEMHQMGHCYFCQFWQSFDIYQGVFLRKIFICFFLFKIIIKMEMLLEIVVCQDIRCS